jgi:hypothetical protein
MSAQVVPGRLKPAQAWSGVAQVQSQKREFPVSELVSRSGCITTPKPPNSALPLFTYPFALWLAPLTAGSASVHVALARLNFGSHCLRLAQLRLVNIKELVDSMLWRLYMFSIPCDLCVLLSAAILRRRSSG